MHLLAKVHYDSLIFWLLSDIYSAEYFENNSSALNSCYFKGI